MMRDDLERAITFAIDDMRSQLATERGLKLHIIALSVITGMGRPALGDCNSMTECKVNGLTIRYRPKQRWLDVLYDGRVLTVKPCIGAVKVLHYTPGEWEVHLIEAKKVAA